MDAVQACFGSLIKRMPEPIRVEFLEQVKHYTKYVEDNAAAVPASLVRSMREAQKQYFKMQTGLDNCKRLEREVDRRLAATPPPPKVEQQGLF